MIRRPIQPAAAVTLGVLSIVLLLLGYSWLSYRQHQLNPSDTTIPTWSQLAEGVRLAVKYNERDDHRWILADAQASGYRLFAGLTVGIVGAVVLGMLMGCLASCEAFFHPPLSLASKIPPTAAMAVFFVLFGTDTSMYVSMIAFGILPTLAITVYLAVKEFPDELQYKAYTLGASHAEMICTIIFRSVLPKLIDAVRLVIGPAMVFLIAAEMVAGEPGFGYRIRMQLRLVNMNVVYPYLIILAAFGFAMDFVLRWMQRKCCPWHQGVR